MTMVSGRVIFNFVLCPSAAAAAGGLLFIKY